MMFVQELFDFIKKSPTAFHTVETVKNALIAEGFSEVYENALNSFSDGGKHFVIRGGSSVIAFKGGKNKTGYMIAASHSDSPAFKVKSETAGHYYVRLATEKYGGMIYYTWLDRPLSIAGRVVVKTPDGIKTKLVNIDKPSLVIPSVAIHLNRGVNDSCKLNPAVDMLPLAGLKDSAGEIMKNAAEQAGTSVGDIISHDLFVYNAEEGRVVGINDELILSPRIDDLGCVYSSLRAFINAPENDDAVSVLAVFDNEEVGSETKQGAASTFMDMTLKAIAGSDGKYREMLYNSFMVSADNAHAVHPNHPELYDSTYAPTLGKGIVVKYNANQRYTTDAVSAAVFSTLSDRAEITTQKYANRADMLGGSTLGSIANTSVSISTIDIGLPQLAMHSANETAAVSDLADMVKVLTELYSSKICRYGEEIKIIK